MSKIILIIIATVNPGEPEALDHYLHSMNALYAEAGAKPVGRYRISRPLMGEKTPSLIAIMEFPSQEALDQVFKSTAYQGLLPYREKAFLSLEAYLSEE